MLKSGSVLSTTIAPAGSSATPVCFVVGGPAEFLRVLEGD
jgi:hypothetical protein